MNLEALKAAVSEFVAEIDDLYGYFMDSTIGFAHNLRLMQEREVEQVRLMGSQERVDAVLYSYLDKSPMDPDHRVLHQTTQANFKARNSKRGANYRRSVHILIVFIYEYWETEYRGRIATNIDIPRNDLKLPLMGDLRLLRHDIIHHQGVLRPATIEKLEVINGFTKGAGKLNFQEDQIEALLRGVKGMLDKIVVDAGGGDPGHRTVWHF